MQTTGKELERLGLQVSSVNAPEGTDIFLKLCSCIAWANVDWESCLDDSTRFSKAQSKCFERRDQKGRHRYSIKTTPEASPEKSRLCGKPFEAWPQQIQAPKGLKEDLPRAQDNFDEIQNAVLPCGWKKGALFEETVSSQWRNKAGIPVNYLEKSETAVHVCVGVFASVYDTKRTLCRFFSLKYTWSSLSL